MKRSRFSEEQIIGVLKEAEAGVPMKDLCRRVGVSEATFYHWKAKYGGMEVNEARRLRQVEEENGRLKRIVAQQALDLDALKVVLAKSGRPAGEARSGACRAGRIRAERATWADGDAPRELAVPAEGTERSGVAGSAAGVGRRASAIRLSAAVHFPAAGEDRGRNASVVGQSQADRARHVAARSACGADTGGAAGAMWNTGCDPGRQWNRVHQPRRGSVGLSKPGSAALHRAWQAHAERIHRKLQREVPG